MKRIEALQAIVDTTPDVPVIATCAATSRELASIADRPNHLYLLDAMGLAISVGTGIAQAIKNTPITRTVVIEGDGSLLMNPGSAITAGYLAPENLVIILLDNGVYASTASIPTQAVTIDLGRFAESVDLKVLRADNPEELTLALKQTLTQDGPWFIHTRTEPGNEPGTKLLLIDPVTHGNRFQNWLTPRLAEAS
ncbi:thiamine pyrophosphate-dependent enzyme [Paenarthrobacter nicotinovorans]|uniref:thiamine pyrophosphate-dependent enzyme n=1 Tax=Paenarthrobacter nicotinovorans TaxID=29320 RepID=UPI0016667E18|nr:thiamine pyrophosphate-dependent enzyme [Paenarthrobacter nicotinovorans]MBP2392837.1 thiamine pyrophosphate-dependent acetolactate synthase large subunit-like protein [Paenarthrobacter nicotinovorans]UKF00866.1 thiamine pyrophosphate-dependent enzyme [Paenarthrobacter nicotinovorans]UKF05649.1 thiamine pyrophosphate-dependent enzyme [Paenarthrobacter nicotinovorans]GGV28585.1 sulfopyruvate decarboxylase subunit beta [Paenarthrobacter nicotinovorans]